MTVRRVARFSAHGARDGSPGGRGMLYKTALRILDLVAVFIAILLVSAPLTYRHKLAEEAIDRWSAPRLAEIAQVETDWMTLPNVPNFEQGDEPQVRAFLADQPLVLALQDRKEPHTLWLNRGGRFIHGGDRATIEALQQWFAEADHAKSFIWFPKGGLPGEARPDPRIILRGDRWLVAKHWKEGSPEVERSLRAMVSTDNVFRIVLLKDGDEKRQDLQPQPWGAEPNLQGDPYRGVHAIFSTQVLSNEFPGWTFTIIPFAAEAKALQHTWRVKFWLASAGSGLIGVALALGLYLRARARRKAALDADRMASMTHSLKTPLAILKFRCDTLRLGRIPPDQMDAQLIQIGEEADRLSSIIENALMAIQGTAQAGPQVEVTPRWVESIADDLAPAFEAVDRKLVVRCGEHAGRAALPSLRAALFTLVENALFHGEGTVTLETSRVRKRLVIKVSDEGPGLDALAMKSLGRPFMRIREKGQEGFRKEGQGLGLSLLTKVVEREGWGLTFASEPGQGLSVTLEIQAI